MQADYAAIKPTKFTADWSAFSATFYATYYAAVVATNDSAH